MSLLTGSRSRLLLAVLLVAVGGLAALFLLSNHRGDEIEELDFGGLERNGAASEGASPDVPPAVQPGLSGSADAAERAAQRAREPKWPVISSDAIPRGTLDVKPLGPDQKPLAVKGLVVQLEREGAAFFTEPLGIADGETGVWRFKDLPIGWVEVRVLGDHVVAATARANVRADRVEEVEVHAEHGGAIRFSAKYYSGDIPQKMTIGLRDAEGETPVEAWYQLDVTAPRPATQLPSGPEGFILAIPPGRYVLRAESEAGELDLIPIEIKAGETQTAEIQLRK